MELFALILYGITNIAMVSHYLRGKGRYYQFPFWVGMIAMGWFFPQAIGGFVNRSNYPEYAYADSMFFATICSVALWVGFEVALKLQSIEASWLTFSFNEKKLYYAGVALCIFGFFFYLKLQSLPKEMLAQSQWSGAAVKYLFFANVFRIGFIALWLLYLNQQRLLVPRLLIFIVPCLLLFLKAAIFHGRRAGMMNLVSYVLVSLWFVRCMAIPRWFLIVGLVCGLIFINGIGTYRSIMNKREVSLFERFSRAANADYLATSRKKVDASGAEFNNYVYYRQVYVDTGYRDYGAVHWNRFVFNYVPAQILGREFKESLMIEQDDVDVVELANERYGHSFHIGSTTTGYKDAFGSFGWFGFIKFLMIGCLMGTLYRYAMQGAFLGQLLYVYCLTKGMLCISHGTNDILIRIWIYFFALAFPVLYWAKLKRVEC